MIQLQQNLDLLLSITFLHMFSVHVADTSANGPDGEEQSWQACEARDCLD